MPTVCSWATRLPHLAPKLSDHFPIVGVPPVWQNLTAKTKTIRLGKSRETTRALCEAPSRVDSFQDQLGLRWRSHRKTVTKRRFSCCCKIPCEKMSTSLLHSTPAATPLFCHQSCSECSGSLSSNCIIGSFPTSLAEHTGDDLFSTSRGKIKNMRHSLLPGMTQSYGYWMVAYVCVGARSSDMQQDMLVWSISR